MYPLRSDGGLGQGLLLSGQILKSAISHSSRCIRYGMFGDPAAGPEVEAFVAEQGAHEARREQLKAYFGEFRHGNGRMTTFHHIYFPTSTRSIVKTYVAQSKNS